MKTKTTDLRFGVLITMILLAAFSRMVPHMPNFSPLCAIGLFGAAYFTNKWQALLIPIAAAWLSDLFINNVIYAAYNPTFVWLYKGFYWQYGSYLIITLLALSLLKKVNAQKILVGALASSVLFFLISNFGCFIGNSHFPKNIEGLITCYIAGIPFFNGTLLGNLFYSFVLFGSFSMLQNRFAVLQRV